ncbi:hypothetical protein H0H87_007838 [Tephrocybe sp. NHM501043]|nr:hypothetical protein H0H87_007838 [Tephrocybe sp. NHM501043]
MIFQSPKKLIAVAKGFSPAWANMSPARLFASVPTSESETVILDPPTWPEQVPRNHFMENGTPVAPHQRRKQCVGPNGSYHRSIEMRHIRDITRHNRKCRDYEAQQARIEAEKQRTRPRPLSTLYTEALHQLDGSNDKEDRIFLHELARLRNQPDNFDKFAATAEMLEGLETERDRFDYAQVTRTKGRLAPTFSSFRRARVAQRVELAAARRLKREMSSLQPSATEKKANLVRKERERKVEEYKAEKAREKEEARAANEKRKTERYREIIRDCLEHGRLIPKQYQHLQGLIQEVAELVHATTLRKDQEAQARLATFRRQQWELEQERIRRAVEEEAYRLALQQEEQRQREAAIAVKLAEERAAREEQQRREQKEAERRRAEAAAREEIERRRAEAAAREEIERRRAEAAAQAEAEARRLQEEAQRHAQEETYRQQQQQRARQASEAEELTRFFRMYDDKWEALRGAEVHSGILFAQFPWPILNFINDISCITKEEIARFYKTRGTAGKAMKGEILKWHPDKFNNQLHQVHPEHREKVREAGELVAKFLNNIKEEL